MSTTFKQLEEFAKSQGMCVAEYWPGKYLTIKVFMGENINYFSGDGLIKASTIHEAYAFIKGYQLAKYLQENKI